MNATQAETIYTKPRLGNQATAKHEYEVEIGPGYKTIFVYATNRDHAARIAERAGYTVWSMNMTG